MIDRFIRRSFKAAALSAGLVSKRDRGDVVVLLYHRLGSARTEIELAPERFDRHIAALSRSGRARKLDDALARPDGGVVVTFDDGTPDFYEHALPILVKHRVPAVLYLATAEIQASRGSLSWDQIAEAVETGLVAVGSHTHSHADLSRLNAVEAEEEMRRSKHLIEDRLGIQCKHFAYPWGVGSPAADVLVRRLFVTAALDGWRTNRRGRIDLHRLGRVPVLRSDGQFFFRAKAAGRLDAERLIYRALGRGPWRRSIAAASDLTLQGEAR